MSNIWRVYACALFLLSSNLFALSRYSGTVGKYPIVLQWSEGYVIYAYKSTGIPIHLTSAQSKDGVVLSEQDTSGAITAQFVFPHGSPDSTSLKGVWKNLKSNKTLKVSLIRDFNSDALDENASFTDLELFQSTRIHDNYFKLLLSKDNSEDPKITEVDVYSSKTNELLQTLDADCEQRDLDQEIDTGDYNFDGQTDFSVFESFYAGANTSTLYFLYDPKTKTYHDSHFQGTSLEFNSSDSTVSEDNICCAGRHRYTAIYKCIQDSLVPIEEHDYVYSSYLDDWFEFVPDSTFIVGNWSIRVASDTVSNPDWDWSAPDTSAVFVSPDKKFKLCEDDSVVNISAWDDQLKNYQSIPNFTSLLYYLGYKEDDDYDHEPVYFDVLWGKNNQFYIRSENYSYAVTIGRMK